MFLISLQKHMLRVPNESASCDIFFWFLHENENMLLGDSNEHAHVLCRNFFFYLDWALSYLELHKPCNFHHMIWEIRNILVIKKIPTDLYSKKLTQSQNHIHY